MIWKTHHLGQDVLQKRDELKSLCIDAPGFEPKEQTRYIAIIGGGPKGFYGLERLSALLGRELCATDNIEIHWFNPTDDFGSAQNYQTDQPDYLLINYCIGNITCFTRKDPPGLAPYPLPLTEWIRQNTHTGQKADPADFASRAVVGYYLTDAVLQVLRALSSHLRVRLITLEACDINVVKDTYRLCITGMKVPLPYAYRSVLLATGHAYQQTKAAWQTFARQSPGVAYIPAVYPLGHLNAAPAQAEVALMGMGLTFVDAVLGLTEGRGGRFKRRQGTWHYFPSGEEPRILYPFSRTNLPMLPRGPVYGDKRYRLRFINREWALPIRAENRERGTDFFKTVYPVLQKEVQHAYYRTLWNDFSSSDAAVDEQLASLQAEKRFTLDDLLFPTAGKSFDVPGSYHRYVVSYLEHAIAEAEKGELESPLMAATAVWREATPWIAFLYEHSGFTGTSQAKFDREYYGALCRASFGPPVENMQKILCLIRHGRICIPFFQPVKVDADPVKGCFRLQSGSKLLETTVLVDARIAKPDLQKGNSRLYRQLLARGIAAPFENGGYRPGCVKITSGGGLVDSLGKPANIFLYGTPTEGNTLDNDSLSRERHDFATTWALHTLQLLTDKRRVYEKAS